MFTPVPERQEVNELIEKATQPEELLELLGGRHCLHQNHAALVLIQLSRLLSEKPEDKPSLVQDARFQQLLSLVNSQVGSRLFSRDTGVRSSQSVDFKVFHRLSLCEPSQQPC